jgi:hypothetical protein
MAKKPCREHLRDGGAQRSASDPFQWLLPLIVLSRFNSNCVAPSRGNGFTNCVWNPCHCYREDRRNK